MGKLIELKGEKFGRLTVMSKAPSVSSGAAWHCKCSCGNECTVPTNNLRGGTKSCGCLSIESVKKRCTKHGHSKHPAYRNVYCNMIARCYNKKYHRYKDYGGKGTTVCDSWRNDPAVFVEWALENGYKKGVHLHRIDNSKGYAPTNCEFLDRLEHLRGHRAKLVLSEVLIIKKKRDKLISKLAKKYNVSPSTIGDVFMNRTWKGC